jgi:hypothetical protein
MRFTLLLPLFLFLAGCVVETPAVRTGYVTPAPATTTYVAPAAPATVVQAP